MGAREEYLKVQWRLGTIDEKYLDDLVAGKPKQVPKLTAAQKTEIVATPRAVKK